MIAGKTGLRAIRSRQNATLSAFGVSAAPSARTSGRQNVARAANIKVKKRGAGASSGWR